jgi:NTE family protein
MKAFVLSGGGNRGPLQVGALKVLLREGIVPEMIAGTSAGSINGVYIAIDPTAKQAERIANLWRDAGRRKLFNGSPTRSIIRAARGSDFVADNKRLRAYMREVVPQNISAFGDLKLPFYVTIAHLLTQQLYFYGDDKDANIIDAVLLSAAVPGFFPPRLHNGEMFTDGGVASNLPVAIAIARGATEIWALDLAFHASRENKVRGLFSIGNYCGGNLLYYRTLRELENATRTPGVTVHHIPLYDFQNISLGDFSNTNGMIEAGEVAAQKYLANPQPNVIRYPHCYTENELPQGPPGSKPFLQSVS